MVYRFAIRPLLFKLDPESAHYFAMGLLHSSSRIPGVLSFLRAMSTLRDERLESSVFGLKFANPVGLAAGFDKDARWMRELSALGFGFIEVGTLTAHPQSGNPKPRLFRVPADRGVINRMGFNNEGSELAAQRLAKHRPSVTLGVNLGKSKITPNELAEEDYLQSFRRVFDFADYLTINVSSPNTPGLRQLQDREPLTRLLTAFQQENQRIAAQRNKAPKPVLLKIAPDLEDAQLDDIADLTLETKIAGLIATNTTISRSGLKTDQKRIDSIGNGGLSGKPLSERSRAVVSRLFRRTEGKVPIIGVGGIFTADDAWRMIGAGASLVQIYTGFIYEGPSCVKRINRGLLTSLDSAGLERIAQAVGRDVS